MPVLHFSTFTSWARALVMPAMSRRAIKTAEKRRPWRRGGLLRAGCDAVFARGEGKMQKVDHGVLDLLFQLSEAVVD
jgi:hypothetical protein